jgi:hypothetical protein
MGEGLHRVLDVHYAPDHAIAQRSRSGGVSCGVDITDLPDDRQHQRR